MIFNQSELVDSLATIQLHVDRLYNCLLEQHYIQRASGYFIRWLRQVEVLWPGCLDHTFEQALDEKLTPDERDAVLQLDVILRGKMALPVDADEVYVALEIAETINIHDVERAAS